jgi:cation:H+ antiporter
VGSNIFNVLLILGLCALAAPLVVAQRLVRLEVPLMIGFSLVVILFALDHSIVAWEGGVLFASLITYTAWAIRDSRRESAAVAAEYRAELGEAAKGPFAGRSRGMGLVLDLVLVAAGLVALVLGARAFVSGPSQMFALIAGTLTIVFAALASERTHIPANRRAAVPSRS